MAKNRLDVFRPTPAKLLLFIVLGLVALGIGAVQSWYVKNVGDNIVTQLIFYAGVFLGLMTVVVGFYALICLVLHYASKK